MVLLRFLIIGVFMAQALPTKARSGCAEVLVNALGNDSLVVDREHGLLAIKDYDREHDVLHARLADTHRRHVPSRPHDVVEQMSLTLPAASKRRIAEMKSFESGSIVAERAREQIGFRRAGVFFALNAVLARLESNDAGAMAWREGVWEPAWSRVERQRDLPADLLSRLDVIDEPRAKGRDVISFVELVREVYRRSGEDLVHSGLLQNYATGYRRNWRWSGKLVGQRKAIRLVKPAGGRHGHYLPQEVDHYVRSWLWAKSGELFELALDDEDAFAPVVHSYREFRQIAEPAGVTRVLPVGTELLHDGTDDGSLKVERVHKPIEWVPDTYSRVAFWQSLYKAAGSVRIVGDDIAGETVLIVRSPKETPVIDGEIQRKLFDAGARRVLSVKWNPPRRSF